MVIHDPFESPRSRSGSENRGKTHVALPLDRMASHVADFVLLAPVMALAMSPFRRAVGEARLLDRVAESDIALLQSLIAAIFIGVVWETFFVGIWGTTPGRAIFGLRVIDVWTGEKPRIFNAFLRAMTWWGSILFFGAPFFGVYSNPRRRPLHDRAADTEVRSVNTKRQSAPPKLAELAAGSMMTSMMMFFATLVLTSQFVLLRERARVDEVASAPRLCEEVSLAESTWERPDRAPTRIHVALSLSAAGYVDTGCLETEADYALWNNGGRVLGYLAKGLTRFQQDPEESEKYFSKVCDLEPDSDACRLVGWYRTLSESYEGRALASEDAEFADSSDVKQVDDSALTENIESLARSMLPHDARRARSGTETADWYRLLVLRELFQMKADPDLILRLATDPGRHLAIGAKLVEYRARALWRLGQKEQSKATVFASADALPQRSRVVLTSWLCSRELYESGASTCSADAMRACEMMQNSADEASGDFSVPSFLLASARHAECRIQTGRGTTSLLTNLASHVLEDRGKELFESIRLMQSSEREKGISLLRKLASSVSRPENQTDLFVTEANIRLLEELSRRPGADRDTQSEIAELRERWFQSPNARRYGDWGRALFDALDRRGDWRSATEVGVLLGSGFEFENDRGLRNRVAVAAWRAGKKKLAAEILDSSERSRLPASLIPSAREMGRVKLDSARSSDIEILEAIRRSGGRQ
jgi:uncharacterized RDD family membrane protein YckC